MSNIKEKVHTLQTRLASVKSKLDAKTINEQAGYDVASAVSVTSYERMDGEMVIDVYYYSQNKNRVAKIISSLANGYHFTSKVRATNKQAVGTKVALQLSFGNIRRNPALNHPSGELRSCLRQLSLMLKREFGEDLTFIHSSS